MTSRVLIIEDDSIQADDLKYRLARLGLDIQVISTECEVCSQVLRDDFPSNSLAIVDMMIRWTDPSPIMEPPPPEVIEDGSYMAGLRCCRKLWARGVTCIIFSALSPPSIPLHQNDEFQIIHKGGDGYARLLQAVRLFASGLR
jgi:hypothetical protein